MLLAVDIGNTNITYGLISEVGVVLGTFRITTKMPRTSDEFGMSLMSFLNSLHAEVTDIKDVIISSVVLCPPAGNNFDWLVQ